MTAKSNAAFYHSVICVPCFMLIVIKAWLWIIWTLFCVGVIYYGDLYYDGVAINSRTAAIAKYTTPNKRMWKLPTSTQLRATWHTDSLDMTGFKLPQLLYRLRHQFGMFWMYPRHSSLRSLFSKPVLQFRHLQNSTYLRSVPKVLSWFIRHN
jgi:hypothetical protein